MAPSIRSSQTWSSGFFCFLTRPHFWHLQIWAPWSAYQSQSSSKNSRGAHWGCHCQRRLVSINVGDPWDNLTWRDVGIALQYLPQCNSFSVFCRFALLYWQAGQSLLVLGFLPGITLFVLATVLLLLAFTFPPYSAALSNSLQHSLPFVSVFLCVLSNKCIRTIQVVPQSIGKPLTARNCVEFF